MQQSGSFIELVDETLGSEVNIEEAETMVKVALLCTNASPTIRPTMSEVVSVAPQKNQRAASTGDLNLVVIAFALIGSLESPPSNLLKATRKPDVLVCQRSRVRD